MMNKEAEILNDLLDDFSEVKTGGKAKVEQVEWEDYGGKYTVEGMSEEVLVKLVRAIVMEELSTIRSNLLESAVATNNITRTMIITGKDTLIDGVERCTTALELDDFLEYNYGINLREWLKSLPAEQIIENDLIVKQLDEEN